MNKKVIYLLLGFVVVVIGGFVFYGLHFKQSSQVPPAIVPVLGTATVPVPSQATKSQIPIMPFQSTQPSQAKTPMSTPTITLPISPPTAQSFQSSAQDIASETAQDDVQSVDNIELESEATKAQSAALKTLEPITTAELSQGTAKLKSKVKIKTFKTDRILTKAKKVMTVGSMNLKLPKEQPKRSIGCKGSNKYTSNRITELRMESLAGGLALHIVAQRHITGVNHFTLEKPDRLVIDLPGRWHGEQNKGMFVSIKPALVKAFRTGKHANMYRIVADLAAAVQIEVNTQLSNELVIIILEKNN